MQKIGIVGKKNSEEYISIINSLGGVKLVGVFAPSFQFEPPEMLDSSLVYYSFEDLLNKVDSIIFVSDEQMCLSLIEMAIKYSKSVFLHSAQSFTIKELLLLLKIKEEANTIVQVNNPMLYDVVIEKYYLQRDVNPIFSTYECFNDIKSDILYDIRLIMGVILSFFKSNIRKTTINVFSVFSELPDIVKVKFDFDNGGVAEIMLNTIEQSKKHILNVYGYNNSIEMDFVKNEFVIQKGDNDKEIYMFKEHISDVVVLKKQLLDFFLNIRRHTNPMNDIEHEIVIQEVLEEIKEKLKINIDNIY